MKFFWLFFLFFLSPVFAAEQLIVEPDAGRQPLIAAIENAHASVDVVMYGFTDSALLNALVQAKKEGKDIHVLLEPHPYKAETENEFAIKRLQHARINLQWPHSRFKLTHQKTLIFDHQTAMIMTFNLTNTSFKNQRNFALVIDDPAIVKEISNVFNADWQHKNSIVQHSRLIWSPDNSREKILDFIKNAKSEIKIYAQSLTDYQTIGLLAKAARAGKQVDILLSDQANNKKFDFLRRAGVHIYFSKNLVIHAKVIIVDRQRAMLGSINLTKPSLQNNRELSVITQDPVVITTLLKTFKEDNKGVHFFSSFNQRDFMRFSHHLLREMKKISRDY